ncbi:MAG: sensor histidine kinase [Gemmatimonadaceae bacterium]
MATLEREISQAQFGIDEERHLQQLQRLTMLGTLAAGLGHDLRNLVMPVLLRLDVLSASRDLPDSARADLASIRTSVNYLQRLANGLRLLSSDPYDQREEVQFTRLGAWWDEVHPLVMDALPASSRLVVDLPDSLPAVAVPPGTLAQIIVNLTMNATRAMQGTESPQLTISARAEGNTVRVDVSDNGEGMDTETRRRCFEPFFTTRPREHATGLGLSVGRALMTRYGGDLSLSATGAVGATFTLHLPVDARESSRRGSPGQLVRLALADSRQLVVVRLMLAQHGLVEEPSGIDAVDTAAHLVICDDATFARERETALARVPNVTRRFIVISATLPTEAMPDVDWIDSRRLSALPDVL